MVVVVAVAVDGVEDAIGGAVKTVTEAVVVAVVVVISHVTLVLGRINGGSRGRRLYSNRLRVPMVDNLFGAGTVTRLLLGSLGMAELGRVPTVAGFVDNGAGALTEITFSHVKLRLSEVVGSAVNGAVVLVVGTLLEVVDVVGTVLDVDLGFVVALVRLLVAVGVERECQ